MLPRYACYGEKENVLKEKRNYFELLAWIVALERFPLDVREKRESKMSHPFPRDVADERMAGSHDDDPVPTSRSSRQTERLAFSRGASAVARPSLIAGERAISMCITGRANRSRHPKHCNATCHSGNAARGYERNNAAHIDV